MSRQASLLPTCCRDRSSCEEAASAFRRAYRALMRTVCRFPECSSFPYRCRASPNPFQGTPLCNSFLTFDICLLATLYEIIITINYTIKTAFCKCRRHILFSFADGFFELHFCDIQAAALCLIAIDYAVWYNIGDKSKAAGGECRDFYWDSRFVVYLRHFHIDIQQILMIFRFRACVFYYLLSF